MFDLSSFSFEELLELKTDVLNKISDFRAKKFYSSDIDFYNKIM